MGAAMPRAGCRVSGSEQAEYWGEVVGLVEQVDRVGRICFGSGDRRGVIDAKGEVLRIRWKLGHEANTRVDWQEAKW